MLGERLVSDHLLDALKLGEVISSFVVVVNFLGIVRYLEQLV